MSLSIAKADGIVKSGDMVARSYEDFRHAGGSSTECWDCGGLGSATALTTSAPAANTLRALPFTAPARGGTLDRIGIYVTTLAAATNARVGIYTSTSDANLYPATLVVDSGALSTATTGLKAATINVALTPGALYWLAHVGDGAPTLRSPAVGNLFPILGLSTSFGTAPGVGWIASGLMLVRGFSPTPTTADTPASSYSWE